MFITENYNRITEEFKQLKELEPFNFMQDLVRNERSANKVIALAESILRQVNYEQFRKYGSPLERDISKVIVDLKKIRTENSAIIQERMEAKAKREQREVTAESGNPEIEYPQNTKTTDYTDAPEEVA